LSLVGYFSPLLALGLFAFYIPSTLLITPKVFLYNADHFDGREKILATDSFE